MVKRIWMGWLGLASILALMASARADGPVVLSRQLLAVSGQLAIGASDSYVVDYQPQYEGASKPAPWLLRMYYAAPGAALNSISFTWQDHTAAAPGAVTTGGQGRSSQPTTGGGATDLPPGVDPSTVQQAILSAPAPGQFSINVINTSNVPVTYTLRLYPLLDGRLEPGINPNATPVPAPTATPGPTTGPAAPPLPAPAPTAGVTINDTGYAPTTAVVKAGGLVTFTNKGTTLHTATADDGAWDSGALVPGNSFTRQFQAPGTYPYHSEIDVTYNGDGSKNVLFRSWIVVQ